MPDPVRSSRNKAKDKMGHPSWRAGSAGDRVNCKMAPSIFSTEVIVSTVDVPLPHLHLDNSRSSGVIHP